MKLETIILYNKYKYFNDLLFNNRHLFYKQDEEVIDVDQLIEVFNYTSSINRLLKREYKFYRSKRYQLIKQFKQDTIKIKYNDIEIILRSYFCYDIKILILEFLTHYKPN